MTYQPTSLDQVADFFGKSPDTIKRWRKLGMPGKPGCYDIGVIVRWLRRKISGWENYLPNDFRGPDDPDSWQATLRHLIGIEDGIRSAFKTIRPNGKAIAKKAVQAAVDKAIIEAMYDKETDIKSAVVKWYEGTGAADMVAERDRLKQQSQLQKDLSK